MKIVNQNADRTQHSILGSRTSAILSCNCGEVLIAALFVFLEFVEISTICLFLPSN